VSSQPTAAAPLTDHAAVPLERVRKLHSSRSSQRKEAHSACESSECAKRFEPPYVGCYDFSDTLLACCSGGGYVLRVVRRTRPRSVFGLGLRRLVGEMQAQGLRMLVNALRRAGRRSPVGAPLAATRVYTHTKHMSASNQAAVCRKAFSARAAVRCINRSGEAAGTSRRSMPTLTNPAVRRRGAL
jgi:hypothetical protein